MNGRPLTDYELGWHAYAAEMRHTLPSEVVRAMVDEIRHARTGLLLHNVTTHTHLDAGTTVTIAGPLTARVVEKLRALVNILAEVAERPAPEPEAPGGEPDNATPPPANDTAPPAPPEEPKP